MTLNLIQQSKYTQPCEHNAIASIPPGIFLLGTSRILLKGTSPPLPFFLPRLFSGQQISTSCHSTHLIKKELPALLLSQIHHFHCHLPPRVLLSSNTDNTCGPFANLYIILQQCPGIPLIHHHPEGSFELLMGHNHWVLAGQLPFHRGVLGKVKVARTSLSLVVPGRSCWWGPARWHCNRLLHCCGLLGGPSFWDYPGEIGCRLVWWKRLGFGCRTARWTPLLWPEESSRLQEEQTWKWKKDKVMVRLTRRKKCWESAACYATLV